MTANGWANVIYRIGDMLAARLPRRKVAAELIVHEQRWLPVLQPWLPLPAPVRTGRPGPGYRWPWSIVPFLPGQDAARNPPADWQDAAISLARFLAVLHTRPAGRARQLPPRVPLLDRGARLTQHMRAAGGIADPRAVRRAWQTVLAAPAWDQPLVWLHGDLHPANIVVHHGRISGIIDFGDIEAYVKPRLLLLIEPISRKLRKLATLRAR